MWKNDNYTISTDRTLLDMTAIHQFISCESYWGIGRSREMVERAINNSTLCFGVYHVKNQIGFARVVTDLTTFAYLADVFILEDYRGQGLGKWLIRTIVNHPDLMPLKRIMLFTQTPEFYDDAGFKLYSPTDKSKFMVRLQSNLRG